MALSVELEGMGRIDDKIYVDGIAIID